MKFHAINIVFVLIAVIVMTFFIAIAYGNEYSIMWKSIPFLVYGATFFGVLLYNFPMFYMTKVHAFIYLGVMNFILFWLLIFFVF